MAMVLTDNSPGAGSVAWSGVIITFKGVDYNFFLHLLPLYFLS